MGRKEKKYHFIYKTTNLLSGRYYIGMHSTDNLEDGYLGSGRRLKYSLNKYGKENHIREIIEYCETREELKKRESEVVNLDEIAKEDCINLKVGGEGGGKIWSEEHRKILQEASIKFWKSEKGKKRRSEISKINHKNLKYRKNISNSLKGREGSFKGKKHSEETKDKMRKSKNQGRLHPQYGKFWITNGVENKIIKKDCIIPKGWKRGRVNK